MTRSSSRGGEDDEADSPLTPAGLWSSLLEKTFPKDFRRADAGPIVFYEEEEEGEAIKEKKGSGRMVLVVAGDQ